MLGHRQRMVPNLRVVDRGDDGAIVEDEHGRREFVRGELPRSIEEEPLEKSRMVLFLKARTIKGKPGLSLTDGTDKNGHRTRRWKRTAKRSQGKGSVPGVVPGAAKAPPSKPAPGAGGWQAQVARERGAVERQNAAVLAAHDREGKPLAAPNGKPSNLNRDQWIAVRTESFRRWFGDWLLANLRNSLRPVHGSDQAKAAAKEFVNKPLVNEDGGITATVSGETLGKMLSASSRNQSVSVQAHMQALGNLDKLFQLAILRLARQGEKPGDVRRVNRILHFDAPMPFDGDVLRVSILAKEFVHPAQGTRLYDIKAVDLAEGGKYDAGVVGREPGVSGQFRRANYAASQPPPSVTNRFAQMVRAVKGDGVSKVVDENGEPRVVYHGTRGERTVFDERFQGFQSDGGFYGPGFYFSGSPHEASSYAIRRGRDGANITPVFLALKRPLVLDTRTIAAARESMDRMVEIGQRLNGAGFPVDAERFGRAAREAGYDGVVTERSDRDTPEIVAFRREQIKSATGNRGSYSMEEADITKALGPGPRILFLKAEQLGLFEQQVPVRGYTRADGSVVKPHTARHKKRAHGAGAPARHYQAGAEVSVTHRNQDGTIRDFDGHIVAVAPQGVRGGNRGTYQVRLTTGPYRGSRVWTPANQVHEREKPDVAKLETTTERSEQEACAKLTDTIHLKSGAETKLNVWPPTDRGPMKETTYRLVSKTRLGSIRVPMQILGRFDTYDEARDAYERERARLRSDVGGLTKAVLFLKSGPIKTPPGLSLQDVTDRIGRHTKRWKRSAPKEGAGRGARAHGDDEDKRGSARGYGTHDIETGDEVSFKTGSAWGSGKVVAEGEDGVTVEDRHRNRHQVLWKFITALRGARRSEGGAGGSAKGGAGGRGTRDGGKGGDGGGGGGGYHWIPPDKFSAEAVYSAHDDPGVSRADVLAEFPPDTEAKMNKAVARLAPASLARKVGEADAQALLDAFPEAIRISLPTAKKLDAQRRDAAIRARRAAGATVAELALAHGLTMSYVRVILAAADAGTNI